MQWFVCFYIEVESLLWMCQFGCVQGDFECVVIDIYGQMYYINCLLWFWFCDWVMGCEYGNYYIGFGVLFFIDCEVDFCFCFWYVDRVCFENVICGDYNFGFVGIGGQDVDDCSVFDLKCFIWFGQVYVVGGFCFRGGMRVLIDLEVG